VLLRSDTTYQGGWAGSGGRVVAGRSCSPCTGSWLVAAVTASRVVVRRRRLVAVAGVLVVAVLLVAAAGLYAVHLNSQVRRTQVRDLTPAPTAGPEKGSENILLVGSTSRGPARRWCQPPPAGIGGVEQGGEARGGVEVRQAQPVERPVPADQRGGVQVADDGVVLDARHAQQPARSSTTFTSSCRRANPCWKSSSGTLRVISRSSQLWSASWRAVAAAS